MEEKITYIIKRSRRARRLRLTITPDAEVIATIPFFMARTEAERWVQKKSGWIAKTLAKLKKLPPQTLPKLSRRDYKQYKNAALHLVKARIDELNLTYNFNFRHVSIRSQTSRWGSASRQGNLNFNYRIVFLPPDLQDYLIVHELCHLKHMNHSKTFWDEVAKTVPDYKQKRKQLLNLR